MPDELRLGARPTLATVLDAWSSNDPGRKTLAAVVATLAHTSAQVGALVATSAVDSDPVDPTAASGLNASGDEQKELDLRAERLFVAALSDGDVAAVCSEESADAIRLTTGGSMVVALDPIDGSSNLDINAPSGSIFAVLPTAGFVDDPVGALLQPGRNQLAAGIVVYGPSTVMALTVGEGTDIFALDPRSRVFHRVRHRVALPADAQEYAINTSNARHWGPGVRAYVSDLVSGALGPRERDFTMRWLASLVAEVYRILLRGGIYLYPSDERQAFRHGRLRLVYEANPVALLCEQAGGAATDGVDRILDVQPTALHQRSPLVLGSRNKVERVRRYLLDPPTTHEESPLFSQRGLFRS